MNKVRLMAILALITMSMAVNADEQKTYKLTLEKNTSAAVEGKTYLFSVPYTVPVTSIVADNDASATYASGKLTIYTYNGSNRAMGIDEWVKVGNNESLTAGKCYKMILNGTTANTWTFNYSSQPAEQKSVSIGANNSTNLLNKGWNGIANCSWGTAYGSLNSALSGIKYVTCYDNTYAVYKTTLLDTKSWDMCEPGFLKVTGNGTISFVANGAGFEFGGVLEGDEEGDAPARVLENTTTTLSIQSTDGGYTDMAFLNLQEEEKTDYIIGQDLLKWNGEGTSVPQIWFNDYDTDLSVLTTATNNGTASIPLYVYAPADGNYVLQAKGSEVSKMALTKDGQKIAKTTNYWILTLTKGDNLVTIDYGYQEATDISETPNNARPTKVIMNGQIYIRHNGHLYNALGTQIPE